MKLQLKRSNVLTSGAAKEPTASQLEYGELAINYNSTDPAIFLKDSNNNVIRISGIGNIADDGQVELPASTTPPSNPEAGNLWFNSDEGRLYIYYVDANTSQWVDASPDSYDPSVVPDMSDPNYQAGTLDDRYNSSQVGTTAPAVSTRQEGALWWNSSANEGKLYVLYNDPAPDGRKKWVEASPYPDTSGFVTTTDLGNQQDITGGGGLTIDGNVGIGTSSPSRPLQVSMNNAGATVASLLNSGGSAHLGFQSSSLANDATVRIGAEGSNFVIYTNNSRAVDVDSSGRLLVGTSSNDGSVNFLQISGNTAGNSGGNISLSRGAIPTAVNQTLGLIAFGDGGGDVYAEIKTQCDGAAASGDAPGRLVFSTTADGASSPTERLRIDSSGNVGIGHNSPASLLTVGGDVITTAKPTVSIAASSGNGSITLRGGSPTLSFDTTGGGDGTIIYDSNSDLLFKNGTLDSSSEVARIDSSGRLLVGTSSYGVNRTAAFRGTPTSVDNPGRISLLRKYSAISGNNLDAEIGRLCFADDNANGDGADIRGVIDGTSWTTLSKPTRLVFSTTADGASSPTERMRIDSSGNVGIGITPAKTLDIKDTGNYGIVRADNSSASGGGAFIGNQNGTQICIFGVEGAIAGNTANNAAILAEAGRGIRFYTNGTVASPKAEFLSGGGLAFNGDTAQANALDDYEEGTWTPSISRVTTAPSVTYSYRSGKYTKVGNLVTIYFDLNMTANSGGSGLFYLGGLPFNSVTTNTTGGYGAPQFRSSTAFPIDARIYSNSSYHDGGNNVIYFYHMNSSGVETASVLTTGRVTGWSTYFAA